jgi:hypothetical protein
MTASRWLVSLVVVSVVGSGAIGLGQPKARTLEANPATLGGPGYCSNELSQAETTKAGQLDPTEVASTEGATKTESCPADMVEVKGTHCQVVEQICEEYISEHKDRCAKYRNQVRCIGKTKQVNFCVDRYEYPNRTGEKPTVAVKFNEATELCAAEGKRLCTSDEWTQACEGPEHTPYPYGFTRNSESCNHDKTYIIPNDSAYQNPETRAAEVARVDQSEPSGSRATCVSSYGVFDMTGNVDEWVLNESGSVHGPEYESGLKGGYWGPVRNRCRPMTTDHNHWHHGYQIGFRCCSNPGGAIETPKTPMTPDASNTIATVSGSVREISRS